MDSTQQAISALDERITQLARTMEGLESAYQDIAQSMADLALSVADLANMLTEEDPDEQPSMTLDGNDAGKERDQTRPL